MGTRIRLEDASGRCLAVLPRPVDQALRSNRVLGRLPRDGAAECLRSAAGGSALVPRDVVLAAMEHLEAASQSSDEEPPDVLVMESAKGEPILRALVRTGFDETGLPWDRYTPESGRTPPYDGAWPWVLLGQDDVKDDVLRWLGPATPRPDGVFVRPLHVRRETGWGPPYAKRSRPGRLRFVSPWDHPQWLGLRRQVESQPEGLYRWVDW